MKLATVVQWVARHELWLLAASAPLLLFPSRWTPLALALILLTWLCRRAAWGAFTVSTPADLPLLLLSAMALVSLYTAVDRQASMGAFWQLVLGVALFYGLANGIRDRRGLRWLAWGLVAAGLGLVVLTLLGTDWSKVRLFNLPALYDLLPPLLRDPQDNRSFNPRVTGMALATLAPVLLSLALFAQGGRLRMAAAVVTLAVGVILPLTQAVQALLGLGLALCFLALWWTRWFLLPLLLGAGLAVWALLHYDLTPLAARLLSIDDLAGIGVVLRLDIWGRALAMLADMPFTGIGLDSYPAIQTAFYPGFLIGPETHAHNLVLQVALDLGLPGLLAFLGLLVAAGVMAFSAYGRHRGRTEQALVVGSAAGIIAYLGAGLIDTPWATRPGLLLWLLLGALAALYHLAPTQPVRAAPSWLQRGLGRRAIILTWGLLAALLILSLWAFPGARNLNLGMLAGHKAVFSARAGGQPVQSMLTDAANLLRQADASGVDRPSLYSLLGSVSLWQKDYPAALTAFERQVLLDGQDPAGLYIPYAALRRRLLREPTPDNWEELLLVYTHWMQRYPQRAEPYLWAALLRSRAQANPVAAAATLKTALDKDARPRGVLEYFQVQLGH